MKPLKFILLLILILPMSVVAQDYVFKVDDNLEANIIDTIYYEGDKMGAYQDVKTWLVEQKWETKILKDVKGEEVEFETSMMTKFRYNPLIRTAYADYVMFNGKIIVEEKRIILKFMNIQFGEAVKGFGEKNNFQSVSQVVRKLKKTQEKKAAIESDLSLDKKERKKKIAECDDIIEDTWDSLKKIDEEFRLRIKNLRDMM